MTGVRSQRRRLGDLFRAAADQDLFAAYCLGVETTNGQRPPILIGTSELTYRRNETWKYSTSRLSAYLTARGLHSKDVRGVQAVAGAKSATEHGKSDGTACIARSNGVCQREMLEPGEPSDCIKICMKLEPSCGATERCGTEDHHPFYVKAPRGEPAPIGTSPEGHPIHHSPGLHRERATLMALPQSASVGARGRNFLILPLPGMPKLARSRAPHRR